MSPTSRTGSPSGRKYAASPTAPRPSGSSRDRSGHRAGGPSGTGEDGVRADAPPDDVRLAFPQGRAMAEGRATVRCPGHLEDTSTSANALDAQARSKAVRGTKILDERGDRHAEAFTVGWGERLLVSVEGRQTRIGGHAC